MVVKSVLSPANGVLGMTGLEAGVPVASRRRQSFERLFAIEYPRVVAIARRILSDPAAAEDVAQDVFLDLHRRHVDGGPAAPAWLHAAAAHAALNVIRGSRRRARREQRFATGDQIADPAASAESAETRRMVRAALARIPRRHALILSLRYSGLSYAEVAAALGVGVNQVGTLLRRAEVRLRTEVDDAHL